MPLLLTCQDLQIGMRLAEAFVWRGRVMLPGGKVLTDSDVEVLRRAYPNVSVKVGDPVLDGLVGEMGLTGGRRAQGRHRGQRPGNGGKPRAAVASARKDGRGKSPDAG